MRKVNPNRMELLRLKRRRVLAEKGHSLLEDKLEKLILELHRLIREFKEKLPRWQEVIEEFMEEALLVSLEMSPRELETLVTEITPLEVSLKPQRVLSVRVFKIEPEVRKESYSPLKIPPQADGLVLKREKFLQVLLEIIRIYLALEVISQEVIKTRRRVNSLEYILLPYIDDCIKFIEAKLTEIEREFLSRILRIKETIRK